MKEISVKDSFVGPSKKMFSWCPEIDPKAEKQMADLMTLPFSRHAALMPDAHFGQNMPVGGVLACDNAVIMDAVGNDIGCGMCAVRTSLHKSQFVDPEVATRIHHSISRAIPVGKRHNDQNREEKMRDYYTANILDSADKNRVMTRKHLPKVNIDLDPFKQVGTLGGGNHFLEVQYDEAGNIWIMIHSGSRNIGQKVHDHFNTLGEELGRKWVTRSTIPFLPTDTDEGQAYIAWMNFALDFAYLNRHAMMMDAVNCLLHEFPGMQLVTTQSVPEAPANQIINIHHNYAALENHFGRNYWVHRKGATRATEGLVGIIPGSNETNSYITMGLGNKLSLGSCSHGSGRNESRADFNVKNQDKVEEIKARMRAKGIVFSEFGKIEFGRAKGMYDISESGDAYKDVESVMANQQDLTKPLVKLYPLISLKG